MDDFNSNWKNDQFDQHSELPEGFGWDDMREGIYEKMQTTKPKKNNRPWYWLLLLLLIAGGTGSWFVLDYLNEEKTTINHTTFNQADTKKINTDSENIQSKTKTSPQNNNLDSVEDIRSQPKQKQEKTVSKKNKPSKLTHTNTKKLIVKIPQETINYTAEKNKKTEENKINISSSRIVNTIQKQEIIKPSNTKSVTVAKEITNDVNTLPAITFELIKNKPSNLASTSTPEHIKTSNFKKYLSLGIAGGMTNWAALDATNINHDHVSGFPGYHLNPSVSLSLSPKHAFQIDYQYSALKELFDYEGTRPIEVTRNQTVEVVSSLTGNLLYSTERDVTVDGFRRYRELKYNEYKLHALSLGYRFDQIIRKKSSFGGYIGASYLLQLNSKGKRLNDELDVITFDDNNPLFQKSQFGLRFGIHYNYQLNTNINLFSQIITTKYITNWELDSSNSATRPLLYGLQIGLRYRLKND